MADQDHLTPRRTATPRIPRQLRSKPPSGDSPPPAPQTDGIRFGPGDYAPDHVRFSSALRPHVDRFVEAVLDVPLDAPVPTCLGWDISDLIRHLGTTHRWVTAVVRERATRELDYRSYAKVAQGDSDQLLDWLRAGADELIRTFEAVEGDTPIWSWGADQHVQFWSRRMLHELAVHTADADIAFGRRTHVSPWWARDGIDEFLENLPYASRAPGRAMAPTEASGEPITIALAAAESRTVWHLSSTSQGVIWQRRHIPPADGEKWNFDVASWAPETAATDARVSGESSELYLWLWGRSVDPSRLVTGGDVAILDQWRVATAL